MIDIDDFSNPNIDVEFTDIRNLNDGSDTIANLSWIDVPLTAGTFERRLSNNYIEGAFYGTGHEEVGGVFTRNDMVGAFGATRK